MIYVDPDKAIHPLREKLTDEDIDRLSRFVQGSNEDCTLEELDAYQDYLYDAIAAKLQTHLGVTTLQ